MIIQCTLSLLQTTENLNEITGAGKTRVGLGLTKLTEVHLQ